MWYISSTAITLDQVSLNLMAVPNPNLHHLNKRTEGRLLIKKHLFLRWPFNYLVHYTKWKEMPWATSMQIELIMLAGMIEYVLSFFSATNFEAIQHCYSWQINSFLAVSLIIMGEICFDNILWHRGQSMSNQHNKLVTPTDLDENLALTKMSVQTVTKSKFQLYKHAFSCLTLNFAHPT